MRYFLVIVAAIALLLVAIKSTQQSSTPQAGENKDTLMVFCAAGIKKPVAKTAKRYREEFGVEVQLQYGGTGTLLSQVRVAKTGDIFIAADDGAVEDAQRHGAVAEVLSLADQYPVIAVQKGNPKGVKSLDDLFRDDVRVAIANPEAASIGKATRRAVGNRWDKLKESVATMKPTVTELASDLTIGAVDVAVVWNSTVPQFDKTEMVKIPEFSKEMDKVSATILTASSNPTAALKFARYLAAPERGGEAFKEFGFEYLEGDTWAEKPEMLLYSGGVNRPAIEELLREFATREGVDINTVFNGCGILCASMEAMQDDEKFPDAYYACDICFVPPVAEQFTESVMLTETEIGIVVQKGNPKKINTLADLARPGLKVGLCNAKQSTLGYMTQGMLESSALYTAIRTNVAVEVPTADFLVNQMRVGTLDAAIVYRVNYQLQEDHLDFHKINHKGAQAVQPFSVRDKSRNRQLAKRLLEFLLKNKVQFEKSGFSWRGDEAPVKSKDIEIPEWLKPTAAKKG
ncbi:MAG: molybdate ABC transporter substrate-binding protein [Verrucomicrobiales bacterium]|nr:molybdate ABC transporter substrate-binding protein [Verrucomicrobiales bacterium]